MKKKGGAKTILWVGLALSLLLNIGLSSIVLQMSKARTLAEAIALLPNPEDAVAGRQIVGDRYWVWAHVTPGDSNPIEQSWLVDIGDGTAEMVMENNFGPAGGNASIGPWMSEYLEVTWSGGWEGVWDEIQEYYDRETGVLAYSVSNYSGQSVHVASKGVTLDIDYAPANLCDPATPGETYTANATGLVINDVVYEFPETLDVACNVSDFSGAVLHDDFDVIGVTSSSIRIGLPGVALAEIPLDLNLDNLEFKNFE